jgi:catecholate siderophore receptor
VPQSITVVTEKLIDDRNLDDLKDLLRTTAGVTFLAGETGEEDVRLRGFSLGQAGDIYIDGMKDAPLYRARHLQQRPRRSAQGLGLDAVRQGLDRRRGQPGQQAPFLMTSMRWRHTPWAPATRSHRATGDFNFVTGENAALRLNAMVQEADNDGANRGQARHCTHFCAGASAPRRVLRRVLYYLEYQGPPDLQPPLVRLSADGKINTTLPARNFYGLDSDYNRGNTPVASTARWAISTALMMAAS